MSTRPPLTVAAAQPSIGSYALEANARTHADVVRTAAARVVVFPELSLTGYELDAEVIGTGDPRLAPIVEACRASGTVALAGAPIRGEDGPHIGMLAIDATGVTIAYRKMFLGAVETDRFTPGPEPAVLEVDGWRLGLAICKDTGEPRHASATAGRGIDLYVAGVLEMEADASVVGERACRIATTHDVGVVVASFAGSTGGGYEAAAGRSGIWDATGEVVAEAGPEVGAIVVATVR